MEWSATMASSEAVLFEHIYYELQYLVTLY